MFVADTMGTVLKVLVYASVAVMLAYSRDYLAARGMLRGEMFALVLFSTLGMMVMISAHHFLTLYLGLEILSLCLYALIALQRDSAMASESAMKYFVLGALASGLLLYGMSMVYGATGSLDIDKVAEGIRNAHPDHALLVLGLVFVVAGLAFKLGVVPFHMWVPDVYHGAPTAMTLMIGAAPKLAAFAMIMRLLAFSLGPLSGDWQNMLAIMAAASMAIGNITAIAQTNLKRMLAYSTISHMGFVLLGLLAAGPAGYSTAMFYVASYVLMTLGGFGMILLLSRQGFEADRLEDFKGLNQRSPWYAAMMLIVMISMAGIPPSVGFFAKLFVLQAALEQGYLWLVVFAVLISVVGAFYYLRVVKLMYMDAPVDRAPLASQLDARVLLSLNGLAVLALGIVPEPLMAVCAASIRSSM
jgi:NADH-quinone oxidoreductase subunit N